MMPLSQAEQKVIVNVQRQLKSKFKDEPSGHDWWHIHRVYSTACAISDGTTTPHDRLVVELGALLHDIADWKFHDGDESEGPRQAELMLSKLGVAPNTVSKVQTIIKEISFKGAEVATPMSTLEGEIVQDADRLDALGAIGIARTFAYGGMVGNPMHDPESTTRRHKSFADYQKNRSSTINHFYEKLLLLQDRMNTKAAKIIARQRHVYMEQFLEQFYAEWAGKK